MNVLLFVAGVALAAGVVADALWTTLRLEGHAGPLAGRLATTLHRGFMGLARGGRHRLLSLQGPTVLVATVVLWVFLIWAGWVLLFSASAASLVESRTRASAGPAGRIYFVGYSLLTLGNGDIAPVGGGWQFVTTLVSLSGFVLITLTVTYLISIIEAVVQKRSFASQVFALGRSAEDFVVNAWDGHAFPAMELQLFSLVEQLNLVTEQHRTYPMLHYYHSADEEHAAPSAVVVLDDALTLLRFGVTEPARPAPAALRVAREAVRGYLESLRSAHIDAAKEAPAPPVLGGLLRAGIPTLPDDEFRAALSERTTEERRRLLRGLLDGEGREWPPSA